MNKYFWITFAVTTATSAAEALVLTSGLTAKQKAALTNLIAAGNAVESAFTSAGQ